MKRRDIIGGFAALPILATVLGGAAIAADQALIDAAKAEGKVVWYSAYLESLTAFIAKGFEEKYGIDVEYAHMRSGDMILRLTNEAQAGRIVGDVFDGPNMVPLYDAGLAATYIPDNASAYGPEIIAEEGLGVSPNAYYLTVAYNTDLVSEENAPKTFEDLLDPKWTGQMAISDSPTPTAGPGLVGGVLHKMGEEAGMAYLDKLVAQDIAIIAGNQRVALDHVISGEFPIALMTFNHHTAISQADGAPIDWVRFDPIVASRAFVSVVEGAPNPNAARLLVDYMLSPDGQQAFVEAGYIPTHPDVLPGSPEVRPDTGGFGNVFEVTVEDLSTKFNGWREIFEEKFGV